MVRKTSEQPPLTPGQQVRFLLKHQFHHGTVLSVGRTHAVIRFADRKRKIPLTDITPWRHHQ